MHIKAKYISISCEKDVCHNCYECYLLPGNSSPNAAASSRSDPVPVAGVDVTVGQPRLTTTATTVTTRAAPPLTASREQAFDETWGLVLHASRRHHCPTMHPRVLFSPASLDADSPVPTAHDPF